MPQDRNGNHAKPGSKILIIAEVLDGGDYPDAPITVRIGEGESYGANLSVASKHIVLHPAEPAVPVLSSKLAESLQPPLQPPVEDPSNPGKPVPDPTWLENEELKRKESLAKGGQQSGEPIKPDADVSRAPNDPNNADKSRVAGADSTGSAATPHTTPDNAVTTKPEDLTVSANPDATLAA